MRDQFIKFTTSYLVFVGHVCQTILKDEKYINCENNEIVT